MSGLVIKTERAEKIDYAELKRLGLEILDEIS